MVAVLVESGTQHVFTLSGNQIMSVFDATIDTGVELLHVRHEAAAVHMADAWGRLTGEVGVALVTAGPGFTNTLTPTYVAAMAESPVVVLSGCSPVSRDGQGAFQEMPQAEMAGGVDKAAWRVTGSADLGRDLSRASRWARSGRPGPVHLTLPIDIQEQEVSEDELPQYLPEEYRAMGRSQAAPSPLHAAASTPHPPPQPAIIPGTPRRSPIPPRVPASAPPPRTPRPPTRLGPGAAQPLGAARYLVGAPVFELGAGQCGALPRSSTFDMGLQKEVTPAPSQSQRPTKRM